MEHNDIAKISFLSEQEVDIEIGKFFISETFSSKECNKNELIEIANIYFKSALPKIKKLICNRKQILDIIIKNKNSTRDELIIAIADALLMSNDFIDMPVFLISYKVVIYGVEKFFEE